MLRHILNFRDRLRYRDAPLGERGEAWAAIELRKKGYRILDRNLRQRSGEIDLVAFDWKQKMIVIVEVKTAEKDHSRPEDRVNSKKRAKLTQLTKQIKKKKEIEKFRIRFDIVGVCWPEGEKKPSRITHYENAFTPSQ